MAAPLRNACTWSRFGTPPYTHTVLQGGRQGGARRGEVGATAMRDKLGTCAQQGRLPNHHRCNNRHHKSVAVSREKKVLKHDKRERAKKKHEP